MTADLRVLADNRDALLLAEVAAWLHDMGKCSDEMIEKQASDCPASPKFQTNKYKTAFSNLLNSNNHTISLLNETVTFKDLIEKGMPSAIKDQNIQSLLIKYLGRCHAAAHIEKEGQANKKQTVEDTRLSSPFGYETEPLIGLTNKLKALPFNKMWYVNNREEFLLELKKVFENAPGDTERPINEVDLWDWSSIVAALYKSALAGALLDNKPEPNELKWRLLAIRIDSEKILVDTAKIPALLARKKWISKGLDTVKELLEEEYPLGNEIYRDENGSVFTVPDLSDLLKIQDGGKSLEDLISENLGFEGEIAVTPSLSGPWFGQNPSGRPDPNKDEIPPIDKILKEDPYSPPDPEKVKEWWSGVNNTEICTICWIRPQGSKGASRKASDYWADRVRGRSEEWYGDRSKTIWIDEVADENGRICLITGKLDISGWLTPDGHVKTLLVKLPNGNTGQAVQKTPSFARLRRIWETTKTFWEDVEYDLENALGNNKRLRIDGKIRNGACVSKNNVYEIEINKTRVSVFYTDSEQFIIVENLERLARKMGYSKSDDGYIAYIQQELKGKDVGIYNPEGENRNKHICMLGISNIEKINDSYSPVISILSDPSQFMVIVPANKVIDIVKCIKKKYEMEMGKVRNRLPLEIGLTFAKSHTPIMALMDSGRKMIYVPPKEDIWPLIDDAKQCNGNWVLNFQNGVTWRIPRFMGDGKTEDEWYPYFYVDGTPTDRRKVFQGPKGWLVHVSGLKKGDAVKVEPTKFDFEFMDSASRRFEVTYDENRKRRDFTKSQRPYLLEEIDDFERIWKIISKNLATTQIKNIIGLIETKRDEWKPFRNDEPFKRFAHDVLHNANWKNGIPLNLDELTRLAVSGEMRDIIELYMDIMKLRKSGNTDDGEVS